MATRRIQPLLILALAVLPLSASAGRHDLIIADAIELTLCNGCGITLAGLDYGLIVNTDAMDITLEDLQRATVTATSSSPDVQMYPFINIPNAQILGSIRPNEAIGSVVEGNELLLEHLQPGETFRNLTGMQFMAYQVSRLGPYVGPVEFQVSVWLAGQLTEFTIHADFRNGPHAIRFVGAHRYSGGPAPNRDPVCSQAASDPSSIWPPDLRFVPIDIAGVTDPDGDPVTVVATGITQDEPVHGHTRGNEDEHVALPISESAWDPAGRQYACDAKIVGGKAYVRAERNDVANGRVYAIQFTATDGRGGRCNGSVSVCVPHDLACGECIDDGKRFDSLDRCKRGNDHVNGDRDESPASAALDGCPLITTTVIRDGRPIQYSLPVNAEVQVELFDIAGRRLTMLDQGRREAGNHQVEWDDAAAPQGVYFLRLRADGQTLSQPVVRVRN